MMAVYKGSVMRIQYPKLSNMAHISFTASKGSYIFILFVITADGVVWCDGLKKYPCTLSVVQIIFFFRSFEICKNFLSFK